jgi:hypothetical protein
LSIFYYVDLVKGYTIDLLSINSLNSFWFPMGMCIPFYHVSNPSS